MKVSIILICYNQEKFIKQAVQSILSQSATFDFEVIVADDCSIDATFDIIKEELKPFNGQVKFLERDRNIGIQQNYKRAFAACSGEYIALLEGDDYWIDNHRLTKHVEFLEENPFVAMTWNNFFSANSKGWLTSFNHRELEGVTFFNIHDQIKQNNIGNLSACVFRKEYINNLPNVFFKLYFADWILGIVMAEYGYIAKLNSIMSVYRVHANGLWSGNISSRRALNIQIVTSYKKFMNGRYESDFNNVLKQWRYYGAFSLPFTDYFPPIIKVLLSLAVPKFVSQGLKNVYKRLSRFIRKVFLF